MAAPSQASSGVGVKSVGDNQFRPVGRQWLVQPAGRVTALALKRPSPPRLDHQARANQGRLQSRAAAASRWISQSAPDRPTSLVNPAKRTPLDSALGALHGRYLSQIVSNDQHCLCKARQWNDCESVPG